ncbi:50S ribosomal protein L2 [archaeon]|nr:50S ribosomal protein L2 [archaeon]
MGKRIISQRRGRGSLRYKAPSHRYNHEVRYPKSNENSVGKVIDIINDKARSAPLALVQFENKEIINIPAPLGIKVGEEITFGLSSHEQKGNIMELKSIPVGTLINNIEKIPGNNKGTFCRAAGNSARILSKTSSYVLIKLPSKKEKKFNPKCKAAIGVIAGTGRLEKPVVKAGKKHHMMKAKGRLYPRTSGVAMNAVDHPFGSGRGRHVGKPKNAPVNAPPGRKVGLIRAKRTGKRN